MKHKVCLFVMMGVSGYSHIFYASVPLLVVPTVHDAELSPEASQILADARQFRNAKKVSEKKTLQKTLPAQTCLQGIIKELKLLPVDKQPINIAQALKLMIHGNQVWKLVDQEKCYDACNPSNIKPAHVKIFKIAFNADDSIFWKTIKDDAALANEIQKYNIPFEYNSCVSQQYNIFFRVMYARVHIIDDHAWQRFKQAYQQALIALSWYLFAQAIIQTNVFTSGMITIADPEATLFKFIDGYGEIVSPGYRFYSGLHPHSLWSMEAYTRKSSHWKGCKSFNDTNFGIDLKSVDGQQMNDFPGNKSHLLFGMLINGMTFLKWEEYGTTINIVQREFSALKHTMRYFKKRGKEDVRFNRREKTPQDVLFMFRSLYVEKLTKHQVDQIQIFGISTMLKMLHGSDLELFINYLLKHKGYSLETLSLRKGNEVILQQRKFITITESGCRLLPA